MGSALTLPSGEVKENELNYRQLAVDHQQHPIQFLAAAQDQPARRDHAVDALLAREPRVFFDAVDRHFGSAAEHREHRAVPQEIDGIIAPFAIGDHAPIQIENAIEFETIKRHPARQTTRSGIASRCAILAWIGFLRHRTHGAPPVVPDMIAPTDRRRKRPYGNRTEICARRIVLGPGGSEKSRHGIVREIIIPPNFRPATALLDCEKKTLRWPGPFGSGFLSPQPPGAVRIGPVRSNLSPYWANESWSFFFLWVLMLGRAQARTRNLVAVNSGFSGPGQDACSGWRELIAELVQQRVGRT